MDEKDSQAGDQRDGGNEDVFLDFADSDGGTRASEYEMAMATADDREAYQSSYRSHIPLEELGRNDTALRHGQRPHSSGHVTGYAPQTSSPLAYSVEHRRQNSHPERARQAYDGGADGHRNILSPRLESALRDRALREDSLVGRRVSSELPRFGRRRPSYTPGDDAASKRSYSREVLNGPRGRHPDPSSPLRGHERPKTSLAGSDSAHSQTAESTVWDDLDDLKSRIKKLELGGKIPSPSAAAAIQNPDRPRTATTAPTTVSSSPQHLRKSGIKQDATVGGPAAANIYPMLHSALAKANSLLKPHVYRPLESTAADALTLAVMSGSAGPQGTTFSAASIINGVTTSDRQIRRKADSMCRNLTDLCIAMCDAKSEEVQSPASQRKFSRDTPPRAVRDGIDTGDTVSLVGSEITLGRQRPPSRLEDFRAARGLNPALNGSPDIPTKTFDRSSSTTPKDYTTRYSLDRRREDVSERLPSYEREGTNDLPLRAPSRAMSEVGSSARSFANRRERLHNGTQRSPSLRESLVARRVSAGISIKEEDDARSEVYAPSLSGLDGSKRRVSDRFRGPASEVGSTPWSSRRTPSTTDSRGASTRYTTPTTRRSSLHQRLTATE